MKKNIKIISIFSLILVLSLWFIAILEADENNILQWYNLYLERNTSVCKVYEPEKPIFSWEDYPDLNKDASSPEEYTYWIDGNDLDVAKAIYSQTVNTIYTCAMLNTQERSINFIMQELWESKDTGYLNKIYTAQLWNLQRLRNENNCLNTNKSNDPFDKKNMLDQLTFELCKYNNYLEYLKEYNSVIANVIKQDKKSKAQWEETIMENYNISKIAELERNKKQEINNAIEQAYTLYPIALKTFQEYETHLPIHDLLTLIQKDYVDLRLELHKTLTPINQVVYKISNAMKE